MADGQMGPADIAAMAGNQGWGDASNCWLFILLFLALCGGWGGGLGWGGNGANNAAAATDAAIAAQGGYVTKADLDSTVRMQALQTGQQGITDAVTASEQRLTSTLGDLKANQQANAQAQQSCCNDLKYTSALNTSAINQNVTAQGQRVLDALAADKADRQAQRIADLQQQLAAAQTQAAINQATAGVVRYPMASTYSSGANPFCGCGMPNGCCAAA